LEIGEPLVIIRHFIWNTWAIYYFRSYKVRKGFRALLADVV
jgi:hypothetical protein